MGKKHDHLGLPPRHTPGASADSAATTPAASQPGWRGFVLGNLLGAVTGFMMRPIAAIILGFASIFLGLAWQVGPQPSIDAAHYSAFTAHVDARIVESWVALEFDPASMGTHARWRPFAKAQPCEIVEYAGDWGAPLRRAFCGNRFALNESYTLHDLDTLAPNVPFAWLRDERGFALPQLRLSPTARTWLAANAPADTFMMSDPPPETELDALQVEFDRPLEHAVAGWSTPLPAFPLALDPRHAENAMPSGYVESRRVPGPIGRWLLVLVMAGIGLLVWTEGMAVLLSGLPLRAAILAGALPLLALPWWSEHIPRALARLSPEVAEVIGDMFADFDRTGLLVATEPRRAALADGERVQWKVGDGVYAETLGRIHFTAPTVAAANANAAMAGLVDEVTTQMRAFDAQTQIALFKRLREDKVSRLQRAGFAFVPAARAALLDAQRDPGVQRAAQRFLDEWVTQPIEQPDPHNPAYRERVHILATLADVPVPEIANAVSVWVTQDASDTH
ncbi:MAG: hypothetical protein ABIS07_07800 [Dokdonella sp.]